MVRKILAVSLVFMLLGTGLAQDRNKKSRHTSSNPRKCKKCLPAYEKAVAYLKKELSRISFPAKMVTGWLFLADGRYPKELQSIIKTAIKWESLKGRNNHARNWYPALAGVLLAEYYKF